MVMTQTRLAMSVLLISLLLLSHSTTNAFDGTGSELQQVCSQPKGTQERRLCAAYIGGMVDGMWASQMLLALPGYKSGCVRRLSDDDAIALVMEYLIEVPRVLNDPMFPTVSAALATKFRCK
jgi:hypothetical protein